jgi:4,5-DOPA dioxygenase extradiol
MTLDAREVRIMTARLPVVFIGHGNPMHALGDDAFTRTLARLGREIGRPSAIVCVSAHWMTEGTWATHMAKPKTIHDFSGFPKELFAVQYPAPGSPETAEALRDVVTEPKIQLDDELWGLDHGTWAVLRHMYPRADVPVIQLSVYLEQPGEYHLALGQRLAALRDRGVLIVGSGNVVHNLPKMDWSGRAGPYEWAVEFDAFVKQQTEDGNANGLSGDPRNMPGGRESVPTPDHWYPYLYSLGAAAGDKIRWEFEGIENASISMRCASFGRRS